MTNPADFSRYSDVIFNEDEGHEYDDLPRHNYPRAFLLVGVFAVIVGAVIAVAVTR